MSSSLSGDASLHLPEFDAPPASPLDLAQRWLDAADERDVSEPKSMTLATAGADGRVSARTVDVKRLDDRGLVFGTSTLSPKGRQLADNPHAALQVYWRETMQQLRFEGRAVQLSDDESDALFADRSPKSRAATAIADQSAVLEPRTLQDLIDDANVLLDESDDAVPRPAGWVAWRLEPDVVEFWHGSRDRMHRRLQYVLADGAWSATRLQP
ncbi:pyridoxal 5'-phosphate synthase [Curtobacterium sp. VKM Ac-2887]|uniref:pyridoxal 5'-phosphate synthase n=1 Tax=Curtobacterium sp. VKM Ac-2887 TaxID=2783819 RepID=UPI00188A0F98|nr:pyridoxal 5'-phosphate synthase [Curtobacterium sp. VKM Ac-2887]MBF4584610.1 pyridoxal 5'-phosphate synthase [Curtobacterium sp. VKM Ac-2887]